MTTYNYIGLWQYRKIMNSIKFLTWITWESIFDVSERGNIRKNQAEKKKTLYLKKHVCAHTCVFM